MATKKKKTHPGAKSRVQGSAARGAGGAPLDLGDVGLTEMPPESDPNGKAEYFLKMLDAFAQQGTQEAKRIRSALIEAIAEYRTAIEEKVLSAEERREVQTRLKARLFGIEAGVMELLIRSVSKMRDKILEQARTLGTRSAAGKTAHAAADGVGQIAAALETMLQAANTGREELREKANQMMAKARDVFAGIG